MAFQSSKLKAQSSKKPASKQPRRRAGGGANSDFRNARALGAVWSLAFWSLFAALNFEPGASATAQPFHLPTANRFLFEPGAEEKFFVGTTGKPWTSGTFGCARTEGWQIHEGLDIRCLQRDRNGEPIDSVLAAAGGTVAYVNTRPSLSNYGQYIVLRHPIEGIEIYSLYAHLRETRIDLRTGQQVKAGEPIGVMGRTSNTRERISKERAHVHFELDLVVNERFPQWYQKNFPTQRNDHGPWNGQNLVGLDPRAVFLAQRRQGSKFSLLDFIRTQTELCRVLVRDTNFAWRQHQAMLIKPNPTAAKEGVAGYELALNFNGLPFELIPRAASEITGKTKFQLLSVNAAEYQRNPCRRLVVKRGTQWELANNGMQWLDLLTY